MAFRTQADAKNLWDSWNATAEETKRNQYAGNDFAEDIYLLNMAYADHSSEEYNNRLAGLLLERMRKLEANGEDPYDGLNREIYRQLYTAGYRLNNNDEFSVDGFEQPMLTGHYFGAGQALSPYVAENMPMQRDGGRVAEDQYGNGIYAPKGEYTNEEYETAVNDAIANHYRYLMPQEFQDYYNRTLQQKAPVSAQTAYPQFGNAESDIYTSPYKGESLQPWIPTPYTDALNAYGAGAGVQPSSGAAAGKTASVSKTGTGTGSGASASEAPAYSSLDNSRQAYLNALDAYIRGTQATGGNANSNAVRNGQNVLIGSQAGESAYSQYIRDIADQKGKYKNITSQRNLY